MPYAPGGPLAAGSSREVPTRSECATKPAMQTDPTLPHPTPPNPSKHHAHPYHGRCPSSAAMSCRSTRLPPVRPRRFLLHLFPRRPSSVRRCSAHLPAMCAAHPCMHLIAHSDKPPGPSNAPRTICSTASAWALLGLAGSCYMSKLMQCARQVLTHAAALAWNKHCCRTHVIMGQASGMHTVLLHEVGHMCDMSLPTRRLQITCQMSRQAARTNSGSEKLEQ